LRQSIAALSPPIGDAMDVTTPAARRPVFWKVSSLADARLTVSVRYRPDWLPAQLGGPGSVVTADSDHGYERDRWAAVGILDVPRKRASGSAGITLGYDGW